MMQKSKIIYNGNYNTHCRKCSGRITCDHLVPPDCIRYSVLLWPYNGNAAGLLQRFIADSDPRLTLSTFLNFQKMNAGCNPAVLLWHRWPAEHRRQWGKSKPSRTSIPSNPTVLFWYQKIPSQHHSWVP